MATFLLATVTIAAQAAGTADSEQAENQAAALKSDAISELRTQLAAKLAKDYPADTRVSVYLDISVARFVMERATLEVDQQEKISKTYSGREALALLDTGADRLMRLNIGPGNHNLRIAYEGYLQGSSRSAAPLSGDIELNFEARPGAQAFILPAAPDALRPRRTLAKTPPETWSWKSEVEDPRLERVRYLRALDADVDALLELLEIAGATDDENELPSGYHTLIAHSYLDFGMRNRALAAVRQDWDAQDHREDTANAWLRIARLDYDHGKYDQAADVLDTATRTYAEYAELDWLDLQSRVWLAQGQAGKAATALEKAARLLDDDAEQLEPNYPDALHVRYNYAIALIESGRADAGQTRLNELGDDDSPAAGKLRDQANLALAFHYLRNQQASSATALFQRLPLSGPYTNKGLLGLGWTQSGGGFASPAADDAGLRSALVAWSELSGRDPVDPAVQEALLARAFAIEKLGLYAPATRNYQHAINAYRDVRKTLERELRTLRAGRLSDDVIAGEAQALPPSDALARSYAGNAVANHRQTYEALRTLRATVAKYEGSLSLMEKMRAAADRQIELAQQHLADAVEAQLDSLAEYEISARFGLIRSYARQQKSSSILRATPTAGSE